MNNQRNRVGFCLRRTATMLFDKPKLLEHSDVVIRFLFFISVLLYHMAHFVKNFGRKVSFADTCRVPTVFLRDKNPRPFFCKVDHLTMTVDTAEMVSLVYLPNIIFCCVCICLNKIVVRLKISVLFVTNAVLCLVGTKYPRVCVVVACRDCRPWFVQRTRNQQLSRSPSHRKKTVRGRQDVRKCCGLVAVCVTKILFVM